MNHFIAVLLQRNVCFQRNASNEAKVHNKLKMQWTRQISPSKQLNTVNSFVLIEHSSVTDFPAEINK